MKTATPSPVSSLESLEPRLMLSADGLRSSQQVLVSTGLPNLNVSAANSAPTVATEISMTGGSEIRGRTASLTVLGADDGGESSLRYQWQTISAPTGGTVAYSGNGSNSAKKCNLTFSRAGSYTVQVTIQDRGGLKTESRLELTVSQTFTSIGLRNSENRVIAAGSTLRTEGNSQDIAAVAVDQFGQPMADQPTIVWQATKVPTNAAPVLTSTGNAIRVEVNRAGAYGLRAQSGVVTASVNLEIQQVLSTAAVTTLSGTTIEQNQEVNVTTTSLQLNFRGFDQFGNSMTSMPKMSWTTTSGPTGGKCSASLSGTVTKLTFNRPGTYLLSTQKGSVNFSMSVSVVPTLARIRVTTLEQREVVAGRTLPVSGISQRLITMALDQFGQAMGEQPVLEWSVVTAPSGGQSTISTSGREVTFSFSKAGNYGVRTTSGFATVGLTFSVSQTLTSLRVTPGTLTVAYGASQLFVLQRLDQFEQPFTAAPSVTWSTTAGTITSRGLFTAGSQAGSFSVTARAAGLTKTVEVTVVAPTPPTGLVDPALASLVESLYDDGRLDRGEIIQVLRSAGSDGMVDVTELSDFRFLVSDSSPFVMPGYVRDLASDVVNSNPANRTFRGQTAGNLSAGSSATLLNNLVDKWFLGADTPQISGSGLSYQTAVGNLFNGTPSRADALQGMLGDCYFIAALASIADRSADAVRNMFIDNGDGTWTVRFYAAAGSGTGTADYVTVNRQLPAHSNGVLGYSGYGQSVSETSTTLWIALAEKAYAQWNETGKEGRDGTNRYAAIEGGWMGDVNFQVLGKNSANYSLSGSNKQFLTSGLSSGKAVTLGTLQNASAGGLYGSHAYIVTGYNSSADTFSLHNPWGTSHPSSLSWAQLQSNCSMCVVADVSGSQSINAANSSGTQSIINVVAPAGQTMPDLFASSPVVTRIESLVSAPENTSRDESSAELPADTMASRKSAALAEKPGHFDADILFAGDALNGNELPWFTPELLDQTFLEMDFSDLA